MKKNRHVFNAVFSTQPKILATTVYPAASLSKYCINENTHNSESQCVIKSNSGQIRWEPGEDEGDALHRRL